jgi:hypothetical protein
MRNKFNIKTGPFKRTQEGASSNTSNSSMYIRNCKCESQYMPFRPVSDARKCQLRKNGRKIVKETAESSTKGKND